MLIIVDDVVMVFIFWCLPLVIMYHSRHASILSIIPISHAILIYVIDDDHVVVVVVIVIHDYCMMVVA